MLHHKIILFLLLSISIFGQSGKSVLTQAQKDSIDNRIRAAVVADDTSALKLMDGIASESVFLKAVNTTANVGGGWFQLMDDSDYPENGVYSFTSATSGKNWVRESYLQGEPINVQWGGVAPTKSTSFRTQIQKVFDSAVEKKDVIWFPPINNGETYNNGYWCDSTVILKKNVPIIMEAELLYAPLFGGDGVEDVGDTLLIIGETGSNNLNFNGSVIRVQTQTSSYTTFLDSTVGVVIKNVLGSNFTILEASYFQTSVILFGDDDSFGSNNIFLGNLDGGQIHLLIATTGDGFATGNQFYGGRFRNSFTPNIAPTTAIKITGSSSENYFFNPSVEVFKVDGSTAAWVDGCNNNYFLYARAEPASIYLADSLFYAFKVTGDAYNNVWQGGADWDSYNFSEANFPNKFLNWTDAIELNKYPYKLFDVSDFRKITNAYSSTTSKVNYYVQGMSFLTYADTVIKRTTEKVVLDNEGIGFSQFTSLGIMVETEKAKEFQINWSHKLKNYNGVTPNTRNWDNIDTLGRVIVKAYDTNGYLITDSGAVIGNDKNFYYDATYFKAFVSNTHAIYQGYYKDENKSFRVSDDVKKIWVGISGVKTLDYQTSNNLYVTEDTQYKSFSLYADKQANVWSGYGDASINTHKPISLVSPIGYYNQGSIVYNDTAAVGYVGWVCTTSGAKNTYARIDDHSYTYPGFQAVFSDGSVWVILYAATSGSSEPSIVGKVVGDTVLDGDVLWKKISDTSTSVWKSFGKLE